MGKIKITIEDLFNLPTAEIYNPDSYKPLASVEIDSRKVKKETLFVAIKGEKLDGHDFVHEAIKKGAGAVVINKNKFRNFSKIGIPVITVEDSIKAYGNIARVWRKKINAKVISVTGSNGKTTTKEIVSTLLSEKFEVIKTEANNNNHIGVPLTILSADEKCEVLILEQGTNHFGEIEYSANISLPDIALITNIGDSHLEFLKNREGVYKEKSALLDLCEIHGGKVFLNLDDPVLRKASKNYWNKITYGFKGNVDVKGKILGYTKEGRPKIQIRFNKNVLSIGKGFGKLVVTLPIYGESNAQNFLASASIALFAGLKPEQIVSGAKKIKPVHGRFVVGNFKEAVIIDDTYNSNPGSVKSAVEIVNRIKLFNKKIFVLGDMLELGKASARLHKELAEIFRKSDKSLVLTIGSMMKNLHKALSSKQIKSIHFNKREELELYLKYESVEKSVILVKGSRGMKMEEFVNTLEKRFE
ncbi:MAG: UDP-N-acetylmuramoyl-tripeptide--D-alanyl-D-alanine ligase [Bacteroidota bacterium]